MKTPKSSGRSQHKLDAESRPGARIAHAPLDSIATKIELPLTAHQNVLVDNRQDELMAQDSADGRPPSRRRRTVQWTLLTIVGVVVLIAGVVLAVRYDAGLPTVSMGTFLCVMYFLLALWPAWGAGLLDGKEERTARQQAILEARARGDATRPPRHTDRSL